MIVVYASFPIDPDRRDEARELIETLVEPSRQEDGMRNYHATVDVRDENTIRVFEQYADQAAMEAHTQTDHAQDFLEALPELLAGDPEILQFEASGVSELEME